LARLEVSTPLFLGIDGGGTRTRAFVTDAFGDVAAWGLAGLSNPNHARPDELRANLQEAVREALAQVGRSVSDCVSVFAGLAGITTPAGRKRLEQILTEIGFSHARIGVDHDIRIALAGGLGLQPGIALIVGTGSSCYSRTADGLTWQTGGWEALISDEGSAYFIGREAMAAAARMADGRCAETPLRRKVFEWLEIQAIAEILPRVHERGLSRTEIASFAPQVVELAEAGDHAALDILDRGAFLLAEMVWGNHAMLRTGTAPDVVLTGGLGTAQSLYRRKIVEAIHQRLPSAVVHESILPPAAGAALLALQQFGQAVSSEFIQKLKRFCV
jgi:N-acetylglucosamine kinase-like BadF-type ATPase